MATKKLPSTMASRVADEGGDVVTVATGETMEEDDVGEEVAADEVDEDEDEADEGVKDDLPSTGERGSWWAVWRGPTGSSPCSCTTR